MSASKIHCLLVTGLLLAQCSDDTPDNFSFNQQLEVNENQMITLKPDEGEEHIELQVLEITDSRCPSDVTCVRFGEAEVKVGANGVEEILKILDFCIGDCLRRNSGFAESDTVEVVLDGKDYAVILLDVVPYPTTTNQNIPKQAVLKVIADR